MEGTSSFTPYDIPKIPTKTQNPTPITVNTSPVNAYMPSGCVASVGDVSLFSVGLMSYIHDNTSVVGNPMMTSTHYF